MSSAIIRSLDTEAFFQTVERIITGGNRDQVYPVLPTKLFQPVFALGISLLMLLPGPVIGSLYLQFVSAIGQLERA